MQVCTFFSLIAWNNKCLHHSPFKDTPLHIFYNYSLFCSIFEPHSQEQGLQEWVSAPVDPSESKVEQREGQDDGRGGGVGGRHEEDQHQAAHLAPIPDAVYGQCLHLLQL